MATVNLPFAASGSRRTPNAGELADGIPCGPLDVELFNWLFWYAPGQIAEVIRDAGMTPDDADLEQLTEAIRKLAVPGNAQSYGTPGSYTWTAPASVTRVRYRIWGAGGGGAGCSATSAATGGSSGGYAEGVLTVVPGTGYAVVVGTGGNGGASGVNNGSGGGTSSFAGTISATGGGGGQALASGYPGIASSGSGSGGRLVISGGRGGQVKLMTTGRYIGGLGGGSPMGGPPTPEAGDSAWAGSTPGGGGSGGGSDAGNANAGGPGANGLVILEWN